MPNVKPLILVDGSSYLYRAFHAMPALTNSKGFPTGAIYGVTNMLKRLLMDYEPEQMAVIFDAKGKTFRDDLYPDYKAHRKAMPAELIQQIQPLHQVITALGLPIIMIEGVEADDVIGTLAAMATKAGVDTLISTSDKDLAQLVNEHITLVNTMTNTQLNPRSVQEKFGVPPEGIIDYLTLVGDTSDNIPGVPKVGPKTAVKWLQEYGSLDNLLANADKITGKIGENLRESQSHLPLSKQLVTIKTDLELPITLADMYIQTADKNTLSALYKELEFRAWLSALLEESQGNPNNKTQTHYEIILTEASLDDWIKQMSAQSLFCLDLKTVNFDYMSDKLIGVALAVSPGMTAYIPLHHDYLGVPKQLDQTLVLEKLKPLLEDINTKKISQNLKYQIQVLANYGIHLKGIMFDTNLASYILDSASSVHDVDSLALKYLGRRIVSFKEVVGSGAKQLPFNQIDIERAGHYASENLEAILKLHELLRPRLNAEPGLRYVFDEIEMPLVFVLAEIERNGVLIDPHKLENQGKEMQKRLQELEQETHKLAGQPFNLNSPKQLQEILFQVLKLPILQKTPTGQPSTADNVLQELALDYALPKIIIEYRSLSKLISTYTNRLVEQIHPATRRIHTSYNQAGASTGRLSSSEPNLQNIPIRSLEGRRIRQAFIAPPGSKIVSADYSQIELRIMAHISNDAALLKAFSLNLDIHKATAAEVFGVPLDQVTNEMRRSVKAINFGLIYGMSAFGLTRQLGIERKAAEEYIERYFNRYPGVKSYMENTRRHAKEKGFVETLWGRRLYLPDINSTQIMRKKAAERIAINAPLQGSAADMIKLAMRHIHHWLIEENIDAKMIMQVHDELVFEIKEKNLTEIMEGIRYRMIHVVDLKVPLLVAIGIGDNWDEASDH